MLCSGPVGIFGSRGHPVSYWHLARFLSLGALMKLEWMKQNLYKLLDFKAWIKTLEKYK
jgi:hypothetical protein